MRAKHVYKPSRFCNMWCICLLQPSVDVYSLTKSDLPPIRQAPRYYPKEDEHEPNGCTIKRSIKKALGDLKDFSLEAQSFDAVYMALL